MPEGVDVKRSIEDGEKRFNQLSIEERRKFDEETLVNILICVEEMLIIFHVPRLWAPLPPEVHRGQSKSIYEETASPESEIAIIIEGQIKNEELKDTKEGLYHIKANTYTDVLGNGDSDNDDDCVRTVTATVTVTKIGSGRDGRLDGDTEE
ncbi:hypothetical protein QJS04_geneDACA012876 [Acorus gramineus]|uniref:Uncharacterized protein n=1 Tax=Acorus gramineus TaxID=55184 RepID=A0AAV9BG94_ACOGR|nr:hypothetical protein QJS04_geneDACA012876 [Acorus gramineus]